ncbi:MAG: ABC transporter substrate-binding protein [Bacteroidetes bacterium]|nr:ABC transporter substrate-binding protein [Bacteroidota bacterium]
MKHLLSKRFFVLFIAALVLYGCGKKKAKNEVIIHELSDTDMLNPTNYQSADAGYYLAQMFQGLWGTNPTNLTLEPILAKALPIEEYDSATNILKYTCEIREDAKWDNGEPILAKDVIFSMKLYRAPVISNEQFRPYFELISDMITYPDNPRKITIVCNKKYILAKYTCGEFFVMPQYIYDPKHLMDSFSINDINTKFAEVEQSPVMKEFATEYNSEKYQREKGFIVGSGPYEFGEWVTGQKIVLVKKKNWWGEKYNKEYSYQAFPDKLIYTTIKDQTAALTALKGKRLDVMYGIKSKDYVEQLLTSDSVKENFQLATPLSMAYTYFGINMRNPKFEDVRTREALAHLTDVEKIIKVIGYDLGQRVNGPVNPYKKGAFNDTITPYDFSIEKAKKLLADAGWKDTNGDGTLDKKINGQQTKFDITFTYNAGNDTRRDAALIFKEACRQVGINVDVVPQEWSIYIENQKKHDFEMFYGAWIGSPNPDDEKQIWHTESINGGSNYVYFGNAESDKLIEDIRGELNEDIRNDLYRKFQVKVHDAVPYIFIWSPKEKIAISKRFTDIQTFIVRPGFNEAAFKLAQ